MPITRLVVSGHMSLHGSGLQLLTAKTWYVLMQINKIFQQFVRRIQQDVWERDFG